MPFTYAHKTAAADKAGNHRQPAAIAQDGQRASLGYALQRGLDCLVAH
jgi:hypothetical protein